MNHRLHTCTAVALACILLLAACKDKHEPLKPTVLLPPVAAVIAGR